MMSLPIRLIKPIFHFSFDSSHLSLPYSSDFRGSENGRLINDK